MISHFVKSVSKKNLETSQGCGPLIDENSQSTIEEYSLTLLSSAERTNAAFEKEPPLV